jgi:hypothetical protein
MSIDFLGTFPQSSVETGTAGFCIGGVSVGIVGSPRDIDFALVPSLESFRDEAPFPDISVRVDWLPRLPAAPAHELFDSGCTWRLYEEEEAGFRFDFYIAGLGRLPYKALMIDRRFCVARLRMSQEVTAGMTHSLSPLAYPLDELLIMHRLTQEKAIELHGCGIVRADGSGNLFVGHSGAGKSTTTRLWTAREDVEVLSDDRIIVRRDEGRSEVETPCGAANAGEGKGILRPRDCSASRNNHLAQDDGARDDRAREQLAETQVPRVARDDKARKEVPCVTRDDKTFRARDDKTFPAPDDRTFRSAQDRDDKGGGKKSGMRMYGTPWHGEAMYASPGSAPLARIFVLQHGHGNVLTQLSPSQAVAELFARSFVPFHRHEYVDSALQFLQELVDAVPCYRYEFEPNEGAVERILEFRD